MPRVSHGLASFLADFAEIRTRTSRRGSRELHSSFSVGACETRAREARPRQLGRWRQRRASACRGGPTSSRHVSGGACMSAGPLFGPGRVAGPRACWAGRVGLTPWAGFLGRLGHCFWAASFGKNAIFLAFLIFFLISFYKCHF